MKIRLFSLFVKITFFFLIGLLMLSCVQEADTPDPDPSKEVNEKQYEIDHTNIFDIVSSCITDSFDAGSLMQSNIDVIKALPSVKAAEVTSAGVHVTYVDDSVEYFLFDYGTAFDDESSVTSAASSYNSPMGTKASSSKTIHIFNLFTNDSGRKNQNQLMKSVAKQLSTHAQVIEHPFADFTVNSLVSALEDKDCVAIFISTIGDESGHIAVGGDYYQKFDSYGMPNSSVAGELYVPLTPAGKNEVGNTVNQLVGHTYRGASLHYFLNNISSDKLAGKMVYLSSCHSLRADYDKYNVCMVGWDNVNMLGEAYALIMANYLGKNYFTLGSFLANFKNSVDGIEDKYTNSGAILRVKGMVKDFSFFRKETCFAEPERERLKPHKIQITSPENGGCVNPFAIYSAGIGGSALVYFDYILDSGETVSIWHNTTPQGRVYFTRSIDFVEKDMYGVPLGMYMQSKLNSYVVTAFFSPGVMRLEFYSQDESDYKDNGPDHISHKLEDAIYLIAPRNYHKNDPVQNHDPSVTTLTVLKVSDIMYAYGGVLNMEGDQLKKGFKLSKKGVDLWDDVAATNNGNLFYAPLPNMKKGVEYTVIAYATDEDGTYYEGEPYDFVSEVGTAIPSEHTPEAIDLGLPSGIKWASFNLGASKPEEYGDYFAWGETEPHYSSLDPLTWKEGKENGYYWDSYKWSLSSYASMKKYCTNSTYGLNGFTDNKTVLDLEDDAAYVNLGEKWRMPTYEEWLELQQNCTIQWTSVNGINGYIVKGRNENSVFFPAAGLWGYSGFSGGNSNGYYWLSSLSTDYPPHAKNLNFYSDFIYASSVWRDQGCSIRPVYDDAATPVTGVTINKTELELSVGESTTLLATVFPENATNKSVLWSSSNESVATVSASGVVNGVAEGFSVITVTTSDGGKSATCNVTVTEPSATVAIPEAIDLGLPSGLKWASFNLGATAPEEYGDYYAWGETKPYYEPGYAQSASPVWKPGKEEGYYWSSYRFCRTQYRLMTKYCSNSSYGYNGFTDNKTVLDPEDDAAHVNLGGNWRMPTYEEWAELIEKCTTRSISVDGILGTEITGPNGNSIFLPAAGCRDYLNQIEFGVYSYFWSSTLNTDNPLTARSVEIYYVYITKRQIFRITGHTIRPVCPKD